jgi:hypothetical protein
VEQRGGGRTTLLVVPTFDQLRHPVLVDLIGRDALELARRERWLPIALAGRAPVEVAVATERTLRLQPLRLADAALALVWPTDRFVERVLDLLPDAHVLVVPATQEAEARFVERFGFEVIVGG